MPDPPGDRPPPSPPPPYTGPAPGPKPRRPGWQFALLWLLCVPVIVGVVYLLAVVFDDSSDSSASDCKPTPADVLDRPRSSGYRLERPASAEEKQMTEGYPEEIRETREVRVITRGGEDVGEVTAFVGPGDELADGFVEGLEDQAATGIARRPIHLPPQEGEYVEGMTANGKVAAIATESGCVAVMVIGTDLRDLRPVAEVIAAQP